MTVASARLPRASHARSGKWATAGPGSVPKLVLRQDSAPQRGCFVRYRSELLRLIAQMGLGTGALAVIGGTVVIVGFLTMTTGALVSVAGYNQLPISAWRR